MDWEKKEYLKLNQVSQKRSKIELEYHEDDFFSVADIDLGALNLIDRVNLFYKIGSYHLITESPQPN